MPSAFWEGFMSDSIKFGGVTLDCPHVGELAAFYAEITGGEVTVLSDHWAMMTCPDGSAIYFQVSPAYSPPPGPMQSRRRRCTWTLTSTTWTQPRRER